MSFEYKVLRIEKLSPKYTAWLEQAYHAVKDDPTKAWPQIPQIDVDAEFESNLNALGKEGWELIRSDGSLLVFIRKWSLGNP